MTTTSLETILQDIHAKLEAEDFTTPLLKHMNLMLERRTFDVGRGASFEIRQITFQVQNNPSLDGKEVKLSNPIVIVHGTMTFNGREDTSASVTVTNRRAWTRGTTWNDNKNKWVDMPEGASRRVADAVEAMVREEVDQHRWRIVGDEAYRMKQESTIRHNMTDALHAAQKAQDVFQQAVTW